MTAPMIKTSLDGPLLSPTGWNGVMEAGAGVARGAVVAAGAGVEAGLDAGLGAGAGAGFEVAGVAAGGGETRVP